MLLIVFFAVVAAFLFYVLWDKSRSILASRLYWLGGAILAIHEVLANSGVDLTPVTDQLTAFIPERWRGLAMAVWLVSTGLLFEWLRHITTQPLSEK